MKLRHPIIELALAVLALAAILYMLAKGHLPPPIVIGGQRAEAGQGAHSAGGWQWQGCWRAATAPPFSGAEADFVCTA